MEKTEQIATRVDSDTKRDIRVSAAERDLDMAEWLREAIQEKLAREAKNSGNPMPSEQPAD